MLHSLTHSLTNPVTPLQHKDTTDNKESTYFDFTEENYKRVQLVLGRYPANYKQAAIIPLLDLAQRQVSEGVSE
jgi:NADH:ubiquinone oxidoreductase subunit E